MEKSMSQFLSLTNEHHTKMRAFFKVPWKAASTSAFSDAREERVELQGRLFVAMLDTEPSQRWCPLQFGRNEQEQCFSTAGLWPSRRPWHKLRTLIDCVQDSKHCGQDAATIFSLSCVNNRWLRFCAVVTLCFSLRKLICHHQYFS